MEYLQRMLIPPTGFHDLPAALFPAGLKAAITIPIVIYSITKTTDIITLQQMATNENLLNQFNMFKNWMT